MHFEYRDLYVIQEAAALTVEFALTLLNFLSDDKGRDHLLHGRADKLDVKLFLFVKHLDFDRRSLLRRFREVNVI